METFSFLVLRAGSPRIRGQVRLVTSACRAAVHICFVVTVLNGRVPEGPGVAAVLVRDPVSALVIPNNGERISFKLRILQKA